MSGVRGDFPSLRSLLTTRSEGEDDNDMGRQLVNSQNTVGCISASRFKLHRAKEMLLHDTWETWENTRKPPDVVGKPVGGLSKLAKHSGKPKARLGKSTERMGLPQEHPRQPQEHIRKDRTS